MKKLIYPLSLIFILSISACNKNKCKECTDCKTKASATYCEDDFEKTSDYNDQIDNMVSDGCSCKEK